MNAGSILFYIGKLPLLVRIVRLQRAITRADGGETLKMFEAPPESTRKNMGLWLGRKDRRSGDWNAFGAKADALEERLLRCVNLGLRIGKSYGGMETCLTRSIILCRLLRENGVEASVAFGVRKEDDRFAGHCWVVRPGKDAVPQGYTETWRLP